METRRLLKIAMVVGLGMIPLLGCTKVGETPAETAETGLPKMSGGASSLDELVDEFLAALLAKDRDALLELRVTGDEYMNIMIPGNVGPDEDFRFMPEEKSLYYWQSLATKSGYYREGLLENHSGIPYQRRDIKFEKGIKEYRGFKAYKRMRLEVEDPQGRIIELAAGSIVEANGRFKFTSFIRD